MTFAEEDQAEKEAFAEWQALEKAHSTMSPRSYAKRMTVARKKWAMAEYRRDLALKKESLDDISAE